MAEPDLSQRHELGYLFLYHEPNVLLSAILSAQLAPIAEHLDDGGLSGVKDERQHDFANG